MVSHAIHGDRHEGDPLRFGAEAVEALLNA
jgi:hypothetical protein